jgi:hypothetical protein
MAAPEIIKALDPLLAKLAEIEDRREKIDREMLAVLRGIATRLGVTEIVVPPPAPAPPVSIYLTLLPPEVRAEILEQIELHPEWAPAIQIVNVPDKPIIVQPSAGFPIAKVNRYSGTDTEYQTVVEWTLPSDRKGLLDEVSMVSDSYTKTRFKLTIAGDVKFEGITLQAPLTLVWRNAEVEPTKTVLLEAKSSDGSSINVDGSVTGREIS